MYTHQINDSPHSIGGKSITCFRCGMTSHNPNDVQYLYCGNCDMYHETGLSRTGERRMPHPKPLANRIVDWPNQHPFKSSLILMIIVYAFAFYRAAQVPYQFKWNWKDAVLITALFPLFVAVHWFAYGPFHRWVRIGSDRLFDWIVKKLRISKGSIQ